MQRRSELRAALLVALAGALAAALPACLLFDFTVDDAFIPARYAAHLAAGLGYRFNAAGPSTDGVTALGFAYLLAPFATNGPLGAFAAAKVIGLVAWVASAAVLALAIGHSSRTPLRFTGLAIVGLSAPLAAWSVAGLETGLVTSLAALAVSAREFGRPREGLAFAAIAAGFRPELLPWALVLAAPPLSGATFGRWLLTALPFGVAALVRSVAFGRSLPLALLAKPPDETLGFAYAGACFALTGPIALVAPVALRRLGAWPRALVAATLVHFVAIGVAGGDWMPLSRLAVPALPGVALAVAHLAAVASRRSTVLRVLAASAGLVFQAARAAPAAARVGVERVAVMRELAPALAGAHAIAALDIGWVGVATDARIVDLAGLTDPAIATLPGGHTSKAIPKGLLDARGVDAIVLLLLDHHELADPWTASYFARAVELRLSETPGVGERFVVAAESTRPHLAYVVLRTR